MRQLMRNRALLEYYDHSPGVLLYVFIAIAVLALFYLRSSGIISLTEILLILILPLLLRYPLVSLIMMGATETLSIFDIKPLALFSGGGPFIIASIMIINGVRFVLAPRNILYSRLFCAAAAFILVVFIGEYVRMAEWQFTDYQLTAYVLGLLCIFQARTKSEQTIGLWLLAAASIMFSVFVFTHGQAAEGVVQAGQHERIEGADPNYLSVYIGCGLIWLLSVAMAGKREYGIRIRALALAGSFICFRALFTLASRGAMIALLITIILLIWKMNRSYLHRGIAIAVIAGIVVVVCFSSLGDPLMNRFSKVDEDLGTASDRIPIFVAGINYLESAPLPEMLMGGGTGWNFFVIGRAMQQPQVNVHNNFLQVAIDHGLVGLALFLLIMFFGVRSLRMSFGVVQLSSLCGLVFLLLCSFSLSPIAKPVCWLAFSMFICKPELIKSRQE